MSKLQNAISPSQEEETHPTDEALEVLKQLQLKLVKEEPPRQFKNLLAFTKWWQLGSPVAPEEATDLRNEYKQVYLVSKQFPSPLALKGFGNRALRTYAGEALSLGIPLEYFNDETREWELQECPFDERWSDSNLTSTPRNFEYRLPDSEDSEDEEQPFTGFVRPHYRPNILRDLQVVTRYAYFVGSDREARVKTLFGDSRRLTEPLPRFITKCKAKGSGSGRDFARLPTELQMKILQTRTHWGHWLMRLLHDPSTEKYTKRWIRTLWRRISCFLSGKPDPEWKSSWIKFIYSGSVDRQTRGNRLLEVLQTVEGLFVQRFTSCISEDWTNEKADCFFACSLQALIGDEFIEPLDERLLGLRTVYSMIKSIRGDMKRTCFLSNAQEKAPNVSGMPWVFRYVLDIYRENIAVESDIIRIQYLSLMIQKRALGQPPSFFSLQSKVKFLNLISKDPDPLPPKEEAIVKACVDSVIRKIPTDAFTGLTTKAVISVTTAACWNECQKDGGTLGALNKLISFPETTPVPLRDLETGEITERQTLETLTVGEYLFWFSLEEVLTRPLLESTKAKVVMVEEPGKSRTVTKGDACTKIILDVINKICSYPLSKVDSSSSGMAKSHHAWRVFKDAEKGDLNATLFSKIDEQYNRGDRFVHTRRCWALSTDYETATDNFDLKIAKIISDRWLNRCGLPKILRGIYNAVAYSPRWIYFYDTPVVRSIGIVSEVKDLRKIQLKRGVLMGDPLTKVLLHMLNMAVREYGMFDQVPWDILARYFAQPVQVVREFKKQLKLVT